MFHYEAKGGGSVIVPATLEPYKQLGITTSTSAVETKKVLRQEITRPRRQKRALASLAYHMITSTDGQRYHKRGTLFEIKNPDIFFFAAIGHTKKVLAEISKQPQLLNSKDELQRSLLYLTARSGFYDTTEALIKKGVRIDERQADDSTSLHAAAFYGQSLIVKLLLVHGADASLKNKHGNTPADESSQEIKQIFESFKKNPISVITSALTLDDFIDEEIKPIRYKGKIVARELRRSRSLLNKRTKYQWGEIHRSWEPAFHGTKYHHVESIMKHGLMPSGSQLPHGEKIKPPSNHFQLGKTYFDIEDWANAIFVSPSLLYASHACYSERIIAGDSQWCVVMKVLVKPVSYKSYNPTVLFNQNPIPGEPENPEYRVVDKDVEDSIFRIFARSRGTEESETSRSVVVKSVMFIDLDFLENIRDTGLAYDDIRKLFTQ